MTPMARMQAVIDAEAEAIRSVTVSSVYEDALGALVGADRVITIGMGKAGLVARKLAAIFCATGTPSVFLHPGDAAHGDLGILRGTDVIVACSTSGQTAEVLEMIDSARRLFPRQKYLWFKVIGITSHKDAPLRERCDYVLDMGQIDEPCPIGLTPSASTAVMSAIGDALALTLMEIKGVSRADFGARHRAGYLGQVATQ